MIAVGHKQCHKISGSQTVSPKSADTFIWTKDPLITNGFSENLLLLFHKRWIDEPPLVTDGVSKSAATFSQTVNRWCLQKLLLFHKRWINHPLVPNGVSKTVEFSLHPQFQRCLQNISYYFNGVSKSAVTLFEQKIIGVYKNLVLLFTNGVSKSPITVFEQKDPRILFHKRCL